MAAAYLYIESAERRGAEPDLQPAEAVGLGLAVLALLRQIAVMPAANGPRRQRLA